MLGMVDGTYQNCALNGRGLVFSTINIAYASDLDTLFFPLPQTVLGKEAMKAKILPQLKTMVIGYLKYLVALVVSLIAFWKGWQFLLKTFKKA